MSDTNAHRSLIRLQKKEPPPSPDGSHPLCVILPRSDADHRAGCHVCTAPLCMSRQRCAAWQRRHSERASLQTGGMPALQTCIPTPGSCPTPAPRRIGRQITSAVQWLTCLCTAVVQTYTAVTDARNSDAYAYAINFEYLMATVRSFSLCIYSATLPC